MNGEKVLFRLPSMYFLILQITIAAATRCVQYKFLKEHDLSLENHVMKSIPDILPNACRSLCVDTTFCFSVNMKRNQESNYVTCELNNSSRVADPQDFISEAGSEYHQMAVRALSLFCCFWTFSKLVCVDILLTKTAHLLRQQTLEELWKIPPFISHSHLRYAKFYSNSLLMWKSLN